ncbi:HAD family hydrolase [Desulfosarcina ovata]|uniref:Hydrolase n=1 Tax=Desulfosarcina ovata subsp. ovata TaxID=2752305 RepID=A0A5K8A456_9BACT|nr:HAD family hydrolase [Desulfosarcina ovata]BBO87373.1 hydrolase [Desulfosarcina ovata subsp. ovata]
MHNLKTILRQYIHPMAPVPTGVEPVLDKLRPFSALFFDVYGTLLISGAGEIGIDQNPAPQETAILALLKQFGIEQPPEKLSLSLAQAIRSSHAKAREMGVDTPEVDILQIWREVLGIDNMDSLKAFALAHELIVNPIYPMPGAGELLSAVRRARIPMGIISNAQFYTPIVLEWVFGPQPEKLTFDARYCFFSYREGHAKPCGIMFERAGKILEEMGLPPHDVLYVGNDMRNDILPADAAGFTTALFAGDRRSLRMRTTDDRVKDLAPDLIVTDLRQLIPAIGNH